MLQPVEGYKGITLAVAAPTIYFLMVVLGRRIKQRHGVRLGILYHLFAVGVAIYAPARAVNFQWPALHHLGAATVLLGAIFIIALVDRYILDLYLSEHHGVSVPKFLRDLARISILVIAVFLILEIGYDQTIKGLLVAPGIAAVVIGLAMQDLCGNIIAGLSLQGGKSFAHGDWLMIDGRHAEVIEINWRSTRLRTLDDIMIEVPNREIARQTIINLNRPTRLHAMRIPITLDNSAPPTRVKDVLLHAVANAKGVSPEPRPKVFLKNFGEYGIEYEIKFFMEDYSMYSDVCDAIRTNMWYSLHRHGIRIPFPTRTLHLERPARDKEQQVQTAARMILRQQALFRCLSDEQLDAMLPRGRVVHFGRDEKIIQQGEDGASMFVLVEGKANVVVERNGSSSRVASLGPGDCFGEMSLLTGERRNATVLAHTDCEVVEIAKPVLARSLKEHPELLAQLSELLAKRQIETDGVLAMNNQSETAAVRRSAEGFLGRLRAFFELK